MVTVTVDEGWAWGTVVGGFIANFFIGGFSRTFGIVMDEFQKIFDCQSAYLTLAGGLIYTFMYTMSMVVHKATPFFGGRVIMFAGAILCSLCLAGAAMVNSVVAWVILIGVGVGASLSFIYFPCFLMLGKCFSAYIGAANGIAVAGMSLGQAILPTALVFLIERYTIRGALLIVAGLSLHFAVAAALLPSKVLPSERPVAAKKARRDHRCCASFRYFVNKRKANWRPVPPNYYDSVLIALYTTSRLLNEIGHVGLTLCFPPYGIEMLLTNRMIGFAMAASGVVDLISRLFVGWFSDLHIMRRSFILIITAVVEASSGLCLTFTTSYSSYMAVNIFFGLCGGATTTLLVVVLTDYVGSENLSKGFAIMMLCMGFGLGPSQYALGLIRDVSHSYQWTIRAAAIFIWVGALVLMLEVPVSLLRGHKDENDVELSDEREKLPLAEVAHPSDCEKEKLDLEPEEDQKPRDESTIHLMRQRESVEMNT